MFNTRSRAKMLPEISRYLVVQILRSMVFFTFCLTGVLWLYQSIRMLDYMMRGQAASTIAEMTMMVLPRVIIQVLPIALVPATIFAVERLHRESEMIVMWASGLSKTAIAKSFLVAYSIGMIVCYVFATWLAPMAEAQLRSQVFDMNSDLISTTFQEGAFSSPSPGLTVYIRERKSGGELHGILVHDAREQSGPKTYMAENGWLVKVPEGPRLVMYTGNMQQLNHETGEYGFLDFERYVFDLAQFGVSGAERWHQPDERGLDELFHPSWGADDQRSYDLLINEGHKRLSGPLYALAMPLLALTILVYGEFSRRGLWRRFAFVLVAVACVRIVGLSIENLAVTRPAANLLMYLWPIGVGIVSFLALDDRVHGWQRTFFTRFKPAPAGP